MDCFGRPTEHRERHHNWDTEVDEVNAERPAAGELQLADEMRRMAVDAMLDANGFPPDRFAPIPARAALIRTVPEGHAIVLMPADNRIDHDELASLLNVQFVFLATSAEVDRLHGARAGTFQPYGSVYGIRTVMDLRLAGAESIVLTQGDPPHTVEIDLWDFGFREQPLMGFVSHRLAQDPSGRSIEDGGL